MKKLLTSLLCVMMVVCMMPAMAWADEPSESEATDTTKAIKVEYTDSEGQTVTQYFDIFGGEDWLNKWLLYDAPTNEVTVTLQEDITGIVGDWYVSNENDEYKEWTFAGDFDESNVDPAICYLYIPSDKKVQLNLNGHKIEGELPEIGDDAQFWNSLIVNAGDLTVVGSGRLINKGTYGACIYSAKAGVPKDGNKNKPALSVSGVDFVHGEHANVNSSKDNCGSGVIAAIGTDVSTVENCTFSGSGYRASIYVASGSAVGSIKGCDFQENVTSAICVQTFNPQNGVAISTIEGCTINSSGRAICGIDNAYAIVNIGTIKDTTITASGSAVWAVRHIDLIENCKIEVTGHDTNQSITAAKIIQTTLGIGKITGDTYIKGDLAIPVYTDGGTVVIESGTFESSFDTVIYAGNSYTNSLEILGGTYIKGDKVLDDEKDSPVVLAGDSEITYPFGKTLNEWPANEENTFTLDYNAEKIQADTAAALAEIKDAADDKSKADLATQLQENINAISDETMRASAQEQADETVKTVNGTVTITLWDGTANQDVSVAKGSIPVIADPAKTGYTFAGWYTDEDLTTPYTFDTAVGDTLALYAKWTANSYPSVPTIPTVQKPVIEPNADVTTSLSTDGTTLTIKANDGYEITDVTVNGVSKGAVTTLTGLKTGDKVVITTKKIETPDDNAALIEAVKNTKLIARSAMSTAKGKKAVKVYWYAEDGSDLNFDGYEVFRSLKRYSGFGTTPFFKTANEKYYNTAIKKGNKYYYKVRAYKVIDGEKVYTDWSTKAWRTVK